MTGPTKTSMASTAAPTVAEIMDPITNTLLITQVPREAFEDPHPSALATELSRFGPLLTLIPLPSMSRFIAVYGATQAAIDAKTELHGQSLMGSEIRIYYGMHTDTDLLLSPTAAADQYLRVPEIEKNFLLSPPGSPPLDWTQERESAPFTGSHSAVLDSVTRELRLDGFSLGGDPVLGSSTSLCAESTPKSGNPDCQPAASSDGTRLVLDFGSYAVPSKGGAASGKKKHLLSSDSLLSDFSAGDAMDRSVSVVSLPMVIVENMDGETIDAGTWSGTGIPKDPIPKTCAPPRWN